MKKLLFASVLMMLPFLGGAQILNPVKWMYSAKKSGNGEYELHMKATVQPGWHLYAQDAGEGPIPTSFKFEGNDGMERVGVVKEIGKIKKTYDRNFASVLSYYEDTVDFVQRVKVKPGTQIVKGSLQYMVCDDKQCLPPKDVDFEVKL
ncbi:protein-disulfide reductase DsbD domain-containing protein [Compostibacter hankyongensis]|uniref:Thiol:disulfide interchange protein DsbD N-terminal domain-containing protein n=1 Tax=Compostibacter hankyongensis TaxID=1007089 RepID=A0ABP8FGF2_9BACT